MGNKVAKALAHPEHKENLTKIFKDIDVDGSGTIDVKELHKFAEGVIEYLAKIQPDTKAADLVGTLGAGWTVRLT